MNTTTLLGTATSIAAMLATTLAGGSATTSTEPVAKSRPELVTLVSHTVSGAADPVALTLDGVDGNTLSLGHIWMDNGSEWSPARFEGGGDVYQCDEAGVFDWDTCTYVASFWMGGEGEMAWKKNNKVTDWSGTVTVTPYLGDDDLATTTLDVTVHARGTGKQSRSTVVDPICTNKITSRTGPVSLTLGDTVAGFEGITETVVSTCIPFEQDPGA